jgi:hypothetical protein
MFFELLRKKYQKKPPRPSVSWIYLCPRQESNLDLRLRKPTFYPLNYEDIVDYSPISLSSLSIIVNSWRISGRLLMSVSRSKIGLAEPMGIWMWGRKVFLL